MNPSLVVESAAVPIPSNHPEPSVQSFPCTDAGNAELIAQLFSDRLTYDHTQSRWLEWVSSHDWCEHPPHQNYRWTERRPEEMRKFAIEAARRRVDAANRLQDLEKRQDQIKWAMQSEHLYRLDSALELSKSFLDPNANWDADPWLFGVANGVVDLRTGQLREERKEDRITKHSPVKFDPSAQCPRFKAFLEEVFCGDAELIEYVQRKFGYCLTGLTREQAAFCWYGKGGNGKSTLLDIFVHIFGPFAVDLPFSALENKNAHFSDLVGLRGARFATAVETREGVRLNEQRIKVMTGGDRITARELYKNNVTFTPTHKVFLIFNHRPLIADDSHGMWRRIHLVPFNAKFEGDKCDKSLAQKLKEEAPGILAWAVRGCLAWQQEGLEMPKVVTEATAAYRQENDHIGEFLEDCCTLEPSASIKCTTLWDSYTNWASRNEEVGLTERIFWQRLTTRGLVAAKNQGIRVRVGLKLKPVPAFSL